MCGNCGELYFMVLGLELELWFIFILFSYIELQELLAPATTSSRTNN